MSCLVEVKLYYDVLLLVALYSSDPSMCCGPGPGSSLVSITNHLILHVFLILSIFITISSSSSSIERANLAPHLHVSSRLWYT